MAYQDPNEESKLPMPGDGSSKQPDPGSPKPADKPADTLSVLTSGGGAAPTPATGGSSRSADKGGSVAGRPSTRAGAVALGGSAIDSILGRLVVEQGLATNAEVEECLKSRAPEDASGMSLATLLVDKDYVTQRQLERLRMQVEEERSGQQIPGYRVEGKLGAGAMAQVFRAQQLSLDRPVAIKVLPRKYSNNPQFIERFYAEGRAAAALNHPNIVQAYDVGQAGEFHYFVMEFVEGTTVHDRIVANKRATEREAIDVAISVADALRHAHEKGLIHRDVKPKNIMITPDGVVKLADLGLARAIDDKEAALAEQGKAYGTPYYISPEQIRGEVNVGPQADIYSLGATLYHMVTGQVPFNGSNPNEVMQKHLKAPLVPPDHVNPKLSAGVSEVIEKMMAKSRRERYRDCGEVLVDLKAVRAGEAPPHAHKETTTAMLAEVAQMTAAQPAAGIVEDRSTGPSPFNDSRVKTMVVFFVAALVYAVAMTVFALVALMG